MRTILLIILLLICLSGCEKSAMTDAKFFTLTMERRNAAGPCHNYNVKIEFDGKVTAERNCLLFVECESYESNGISVEKRRCPKSESEKIEKQLNADEIKVLAEEINKSKFFSFNDDYGYDSKNCSSNSSDTPEVILMIKFDGKKKTIKHFYGCYVKKWFSDENALQPLTDLEEKISKIVEIENWNRGQK